MKSRDIFKHIENNPTTEFIVKVRRDFYGKRGVFSSQANWLIQFQIEFLVVGGVFFCIGTQFFFSDRRGKLMCNKK